MLSEKQLAQLFDKTKNKKASDVGRAIDEVVPIRLDLQ